MPFALIYDNQFAGIASSDQGLPNGFTAIETDRTEGIYYDPVTQTIKDIPERPSIDAIWTGTEWLVPTPFVPPVLPDWQGLVQDLKGSAVYQKVYGLAGTSLAACRDWSLLLAILGGFYDEQSLQNVLTSIRALLASEGQDFTTTELQFIQRVLSDNNFSWSIE